MKVLFITHVTDLGGANRSMLQLIKELKENYNIEPFVIYPKLNQENKFNLKNELDKLEIESLRHRLSIFKKRGKHGIIFKFSFIILNTLIVSHLLWLLRNKHFDIVHSNTSVIDTGAYLSYFKKIPHIWHLREFGKKDFSLESCLGNRYEKWIYSKCWKFIAISKAVKNEYKSIIPESKISLIYNGILPPNHQYIANHSSSKIQFCIVGRIENNKNQLEALKACKLLKDEGYKNFHLTIIGPSDNVYSKSLIKYIDDNELNEFVHMTGEIFNVSEVLSKMDVGLMLSNNEAFGRVTVEYMMHNLAVIASNTGANSELIANNETGLLYSPGNHIELKNKMKFIINNKKAMLNLAIKGKKEAIVRYNSKINTNCVYELYCEAMNKFNKR